LNDWGGKVLEKGKLFWKRRRCACVPHGRIRGEETCQRTNGGHAIFFEEGKTFHKVNTTGPRKEKGGWSYLWASRGEGQSQTCM